MKFFTKFCFATTFGLAAENYTLTKDQTAFFTQYSRCLAYFTQLNSKFL